MSVEIWQLDSLLENLNETLNTIENLDSSGLLSERVGEIRDQIEYMNLDRRHKTSLFYSTDDGNTYIIDGKSREVVRNMDERDKLFLLAILSIISSELELGSKK